MHTQTTGCPFCGAATRSTARFCPSCGQNLQTLSAAPGELPGDWQHTSQPLAAGELIGGRYCVERQLGSGGFGETYLAHDQSMDGRACVIKRMRVRPNWTEAERNLRIDVFLHEMRTLAGITHPGHPNIPEIFDFLPDQRCLVMKYISGVTVSELMERQGRLALPEALRCAHDICAALRYMHGRREPVLHRDIKPSNVMLDEQGHYWLLDFGLAFAAPSIGDLRVVPLATAGTPGYAPPEQWSGRAEPRSDIYALAMTLYTMVTGRLPAGAFDSQSGEERAAWLASTLPPELPAQLVALFGRALAREPAMRPDARELSTELATLIEICTQPQPLPPGPPPTTPNFAGRSALIAAIRQCLDTTPWLVLHGPPGIGKRALAAEAALLLAEKHHVWWFRCLPSAGDDQLLWSLSEFLAWHSLREPWAQLQAARRSGLPPPPPEQLLAQIVHALRGGRWELPLLLVFDGLDQVIQQPLMHRLWDELSALAAPGRLSLMATARQILSALAGQPAIAVAGLALEEAAELMHTHSLQLDLTRLRRLVDSTSGNPQLLNLAAALLRQRGGDAALVIDRLAESDDIQRYLTLQVDQGLSPDERATMQALAVLDEEGATALATAAVAGRDTQASLHTLASRGMLLALSDRDQRSYRLSALLRDFYMGQIEAQVSTLHRRAAAYYAREAPDSLRAAQHYLAASDIQAAAALVATPFTAQQMIGQGRGRALERLLARLPEIQLDPEQAMARASARAEILTLLGEYAPARQLLRAAMADTELTVEEVRPELLAYRWRLMGRIESQIGSFEAAERCCRAGLATLASQGPPVIERARLFTDLASVLMRLGRTGEAAEAGRAGLRDLPRRPAAPRERAALLHRLATIAGEEGDYEQAAATLEQALDLARAVGDIVLTAAVLHNLGRYHTNRGKRELALAAYRESLALEEQAGNLAGQANTLGAVAALAMDLGDFAAAQEYYHKGQQICEHLGLREDLAWIFGNIGQLRLLMGDMPGAREHLVRARTLHSELGRTLGAADATYRLGDVALAEGKPEEAHSLGEQALSLARRATNRAYESCALRVMGEAALAGGELSEASRHLTMALSAQRRVRDPYDTALIAAAAANLAYAQGDVTRANRRARRALSYAKHSGVPNLIARLEQLAEGA